MVSAWEEGCAFVKYAMAGRAFHNVPRVSPGIPKTLHTVVWRAIADSEGLSRRNSLFNRVIIYYYI